MCYAPPWTVASDSEATAEQRGMGSAPGTGAEGHARETVFGLQQEQEDLSEVWARAVWLRVAGRRGQNRTACVTHEGRGGWPLVAREGKGVMTFLPQERKRRESCLAQFRSEFPGGGHNLRVEARKPAVVQCL